MADEPNCEMRCRFCCRKWAVTLKRPPYWGVLYTTCSICYTNLLQEFEKQFPRVLLFPKKKKVKVEGDGA